MLSISRYEIQKYYRVLQKAGLLKKSRIKATSLVRITADHNGLTLLARDHRVAASLTISQNCEPSELVVPVSLLADCSQRTHGDVVLSLRCEQLVASWTDRSVPVERDYEAIAPDQFPDNLPMPEDWVENQPKLFEALRDAMRISDPSSMRYALSCVQLDGNDGQIVSTDCHQALIQRGFNFPWREAVLIPAVGIFEAAGLPRDVPIQVGKTEKHIHIKFGPWTFAFEIQTEGRFPDVRRIVPDETAVSSRLQLHPADGQFLVQRVEELPRSDDPEQPVTVELNGSVAIRASRSKEATPTELVLGRSQRVGNEIRFATDRRFLKRAIDLGFSEIGVASKDGPAVCRDGHREFVWATLASDAAILSTDRMIQVNSLTEPESTRKMEHCVILAKPSGKPVPSQRRQRGRPRPVSDKTVPAPDESAKSTGAIHHDSIPTEAELIAQLLELRTRLRTIETSILTIARHLRSRRKQQQRVKATLASLKQLQTLDV